MGAVSPAVDGGHSVEADSATVVSENEWSIRLRGDLDRGEPPCGDSPRDDGGRLISEPTSEAVSLFFRQS